MKKTLALVNIIVSLVLLTILFFSKLSENVVIVLALTLFIGWILPYFICIISGIILFKNSHHRMGLVSNIMSAILCIIFLILIIRIYDRNLLVLLISYLILLIITTCNIIYFKNYIKKHPSKSKIEKKEIKEQKKKNNGAIV